MERGRNVAASEPQRIAIAGDWHGDEDRAVEAVGRTGDEGIAILVHTGDLGVMPGAAGDRYLDRVDDELLRSGVELWFVDGNHDDHRSLREWRRDVDGTCPVRTRIRHLPRGHRWTWHKQTWLALGGAHSVNSGRYTVGVDWWPEETISASEVAAATAGGVALFMVTHDAPAGVDVPGFVGNPHNWTEADLRSVQRNRAAVREVVDAVRPARLFHGHYHVRYEAILGDSGRRTQVSGIADNESSLDDNLVFVDLTG